MEENGMVGRFFVMGLLIGVTTMNLLHGCVKNYSPAYIPRVEQVQSGYVAPSKIERILCEDLDGNGEKETIVKIDGKSYLLMYKDGKPSLLEYTIKPAEVIPQK